MTKSIFDPVILDTKKVRIRPLGQVTWQKLADGLLYDGSFHSRNWGIKTREDIQKLYERSIDAFKNEKANPIVFLNEHETEVLGMTNFMNIEPQNRMIEIGGTWIGQKHQNTFVNTETKFALLQYAFEVLKLHRVEFRIDAENKISQNAVRRLGFHFDGAVPRRRINANGESRNYVFYSVTDLSWASVKTHIQSLIEKTNHHFYPKIGEVKHLVRESKIEEAFGKLLQFLAEAPDNTILNYEAAGFCDRYRTEAEAVPFYLKALQGLSGIDRRDAYLGLASTYRSLGEYQKSKEFFLKGIAEFPEYRPYQVFLALTEYNLDEKAKTVQRLLEQLIETTADGDIKSHERALKHYSTRLDEVFP